jgi:MFS transporter, DHA1 family, inner membrane transport protein
MRTSPPALASGANIAAFNLGNALGAWPGSVTISAGLGYTSPSGPVPPSLRWPFW